MNEKKKEIRSIECELSVRENDNSAQGEPSRTIVGRAIVFNAESEVLDDWGVRFREVIAPEAVTAEFLNTQDVKMNILHERELTLARCNKGKGSLRLSVDDKGVTFEFDAPKCDIGDRCIEMVKRGDYSGCSFEFYPEDYDIEERGEDDVKITHRKLRSLTALTIGMDPAYTQTEVNARELGKGGGSDEITAGKDGTTTADKKDGTAVDNDGGCGAAADMADAEREMRERQNRLRRMEVEQMEIENGKHSY